MSPLNIFLDDGGVITDKELRADEFERLVGDCFVPLLGGTEEAWNRAHRVVVGQLSDPQLVSVLAAADFVGFYRAYQLRWIGGMCELLGLPPLPEEERLDLAFRALSRITHRIHAVLPGAVETIRLLHRQGYALYTASGSCSLELAGALEGMGVRHCFGRLYGADLINTFKDGPEYYVRLFTDVGIQPVEALVVDDSADAINWAARLGARTVLLSSSPHLQTGATPHLGSLAELPAFLRQQRWGGQQKWRLEAGATSVEYRRKGVATALIREAERVAKEHGCTRIGLNVGSTDNPDAKRLYEHSGYVDWD